VPGRARDASERPGTFKPGHKKLGGRKKGTPNAISADYAGAVFEAAQLVGSDGMGKDGIVGYFMWLLLVDPEAGCLLWTRVLMLQFCGWLPNEPRWTMAEINQRTRDSIARQKKRPGATEWPASDLVRIAAKRPRDFAKLPVALLPQPTVAHLRRSYWEPQHRGE
jgi:hypothetical protein